MFQIENTATQSVFRDSHAARESLPSGFQAILHDLDFDAGLTSILLKVNSVTRKMNVVSPQTSEVIPMRLRETLRLVQYSLLAKYDCSKPKEPRDQVLITCHLGILLYAGIIQNDFWITPMDSQLKREVKLCLQSENFVASSFTALYLWVAFLAGSLILDPSERSSFLRYIVQAVSELSLTSWDNVREVLVNFAWVGKIQDAAGQALWNEVVRLQHEPCSLVG